jgi:hypothetical protein
MFKIDVIATCFAQFFDGNMNYIISRSINREKFICFVSLIYLKKKRFYLFYNLVLYKNKNR